MEQRYKISRAAPERAATTKRADKLQEESDNCVALSLRSETEFAGDLIDEAVMLARRARELRSR